MTNPTLSAIGLPALPEADAWQYRECHAWDTNKPAAWSDWVECGSMMLERIRGDSQFGGMEHEARALHTTATLQAYATAAVLADREARDAAVAEDAARYRWLRENLNVKVSHWFCTDGGATLDAAIDAAMGDDDAR